MDSNGVRTDKIIWIFGTGRSGSTWLASMIGEIAGGRFWNEPLVGRLFGEFYANNLPNNPGRKGFIMADATREAWLEGIKVFTLNVASAVFPEVAEGDYLVIKEPNGSIGAPLLAEALPESRVILLVRDPRDTAASAIERHRKGGATYERTIKRNPKKKKALTEDPPDDNRSATMQAHRYLRNIGNAKRAYDAHGGRKVVVRYEDLRADTLGTMRRICSTLELPVEDAELARAVEKYAWENIPEEEKGLGKHKRKAKPGGWREDLTPRQVKIVEDITAPLLHEFYPTSAT